MTVATTGGTGSGIVGLEDIQSTDLRVPRLKIKHAEGVFVDPMSGAEYDKLHMIVLGMVRQRTMWNKSVESGDVPQCKSPDAENGFPNIDEEKPGRVRFPWRESNFNRDDYTPDEKGRIILPCKSCVFTKWGDKTPPPCSEVATLPVLYSPDPENEGWGVALFSCQKSSLKPAMAYISSFVQRRVPIFSNEVVVTLTTATRGSVVYSTPKFKQGDLTDAADHEDFAFQYNQIREYLRRFPGGGGDQDNSEDLPETSDNTHTPAPGSPAAAATPPSTPAAPPSDPWATGPSGAPPVSTPAPAAPAAPPVAPPTASTSSTEDDDDLPF